MRRLLPYFFILLIPIDSQDWDPSVLPITTPAPSDYNVYFNDTRCIISHINDEVKPPKPYFSVKIQQNVCNNSQILTLTVPPYIMSNFNNTFLNNPMKFQNRKCDLIHQCYVLVNFIGETTTTTTTTQAAIPETSTAIQTSQEIKSNTDLYIYIGAGVAVVVLIVAQTACIVSYRRKAENTRRALQNILQTREEAKEENERYSHGPVAKKSIPEGDDDLYESLDKYIAAAAEDDTGTIKSVDIRNRPPLPLPHEMSSGWEDFGTIRSREFPRPPMPLPHQHPHSEFNAKTLPHKTNTQKEFLERLPEPQVNGTLKSRVKPNVMQSGPGVTLQRNFSQRGPRDNLPDPPINAITRPQFGSSALLKNPLSGPTGKPPCYPANALQLRNASQQGSQERVLELPVKGTAPPPPLRVPHVVSSYPANALQLRNASQKGSHERVLEPPVKGTAPPPPLRVPHVVSKKQAPENVVNELSKVFAKINPPVKPTHERHNSSDDEWTYETLPPTNKYL